MSKKPSSESLEREAVPTGTKDQSWDEAVGRYLELTPDYFLRHPEVLAALALPHPEAGRAVSLVERQVRVLRDRNEQSMHQLQELIAFARDNDQLGERVQRFALAVIDSDSLDEVLDTAQDMLRQEFSLDGVAVRLTGNPRPNCPRQEFAAPDDAMLDGLLASLAARNGQPLCGTVHVAATLEAGPDMTGVNFAAGKAFVISSTSGFVYAYDMQSLKPAGRIRWTAAGRRKWCRCPHAR